MEEFAFRNAVAGPPGALGGGPGGILEQVLNLAHGGASGTTPPSRLAARFCCALGESEAIDPTDVKDHKYGSWGLFMDPVGFVYTERAGILDIGHLRDLVDLTKYVYDAILAGKSEIPCSEGKAKIKGSPSKPRETAKAIAYIDSWAHELRTFGTSEDFSAFSPEDLVSNFLGTYVGARALVLAPPGGFDATVDTLLTSLLSILGARSKAITESVISNLKGKDEKGVQKWWDKPFVGLPELLRRNFDCTPWTTGDSRDKRPAPLFIDASVLVPHYADFDYIFELNGSDVRHVDFPSRTSLIRAPFAEKGLDKPYVP